MTDNSTSKNENKKWWVGIVIAMLSSSFITSVSTHFLQTRQASEVSLDNFNQKLYTQLLRAEYERDSIHRRLNTVTNDLVNLRAQVMLLESSHQEVDFPWWLKSSTLQMLSLNKAYEEMFLIPNGLSRSDYIGRFDKDVWSKKMADAYRENDMEVLRTGKHIVTVETALVDGKEIELIVVKFPRKVGGNIIGIGGFAIPIKDINRKINYEPNQSFNHNRSYRGYHYYRLGRSPPQKAA